NAERAVFARLTAPLLQLRHDVCALVLVAYRTTRTGAVAMTGIPLVVTHVKLIAAIETADDITSLAERLREIEGEHKQIQHAIPSQRPEKPDEAMNGLRERVTKELHGFKESLLAGSNDADMVRAKSALAKHVGKLTLTPSLRDGRPVYKVREM